MVGRTSEKERLLRAKESEYSEFVAVYGRRRVGNTFLIRETFDYKFAFQHAGVANGTLFEQLDQFRSAIKDSGYRECPPLKNVFKTETRTRKAVHITFLTTFGLERNAYANNVQSQVTLEDLFRV